MKASESKPTADKWDLNVALTIIKWKMVGQHQTGL